MGAGALLAALRIRSRQFPVNPPPMKPPIFWGLFFLTHNALFRIFNPPKCGKKGVLLKVLKNEVGGGKQREIDVNFELCPLAMLQSEQRVSFANGA